MSIREDSGKKDGEGIMEDYCPGCGAYTGGDSVCPNCGATLYDDSGLEEYDEEGGGGDTESDPSSSYDE